MIDLALFRIRSFDAALATNFLAIFVAVGYFLFVAQYLQLVLALSPLEAGLWSLPSAFGFIIGSQLGPRIVRRFGPATVIAASLAVSAAGLGLLTQVGKLCRPTSGRVEVCSAAYGDTGWLGVASVWLSGDGHILYGTAKMNDTYFKTPAYNNPGWRNLVMCQEVGHTFGLGHVNEDFDDANTGSCMDYTRYPAVRRRCRPTNTRTCMTTRCWPASIRTCRTGPRRGSRKPPRRAASRCTW